MDDRIARVEAAVHELEVSIARMVQRLDVIERVAAGVIDARDRSDLRDLRDPPDLPDPLALALPAPPDLPDLVTLLSFSGRTFVALGGAFLLRALTDASLI